MTGIAVWIGFGASLVFAWFGRRKTDLVILAWVIPYLLITGWFEVSGERTNAKNIRLVHEPCAARGGERCVWNFTWE